MSASQSTQYPLLLDQGFIDAVVESTILQSFFTGVYTYIFFQAVTSPFRQQNRIILVVLSILFIAITINLVAVWQMFRSVVVTHDATRDSMMQDILTIGPSNMQKVANGTLSFAVMVSDAFLAWKCYVLWHRNKWMLVGYSVVIIAEIASLPFCFAFRITMGPHWGYLNLYITISLCITITTSVLIIFRIVTVSRQGDMDLNRYHYTIKILVESGLLYTAAILTCGLLLVIQISGVQNAGLVRAMLDFDALLVPVTGIAPTLISARNARARVKILDIEDSQAISRIEFEEAKSETGAIPFIDNDLQDSSNVTNW